MKTEKTVTEELLESLAKPTETGVTAELTAAETEQVAGGLIALLHPEH